MRGALYRGVWGEDADDAYRRYCVEEGALRGPVSHVHPWRPIEGDHRRVRCPACGAEGTPDELLDRRCERYRMRVQPSLFWFGGWAVAAGGGLWRVPAADLERYLRRDEAEYAARAGRVAA